MSHFAFAIEETLQLEGGDRFTAHPADRGGPTRWGITEHLAHKHGYEGDMRELPRAFAVRVAELEFWVPLRLDEVNSKYVAAEIFDTAFHSGPTVAVQIAQRAANMMYADASDIPLLKIDGKLGPQTLGAINSLLPRYEAHLYCALNGYQFVYFIEVLKHRPANARPFVKGWMRRLARFPEMLPA